MSQTFTELMGILTDADVMLEFESKHTVRLVLQNDTLDQAHYRLAIVIETTQQLE